MLVAYDAVGNRVEATRQTPRGSYVCPVCTEDVVAKPGRVVLPHFAHRTRSVCPSANETEAHLRAKSRLAAEFRDIGYEVALEEPHSNTRRVDVAVTVPHPTQPLRYAVEVQNSAISPTEMGHRFIADLKAGFACTGWIFVGERAKPLLAAAEGTEVRASQDILMAEHIFTFLDEGSCRELTAITGRRPSDWLGERLSPSRGTLGWLRGAKCLTPEGQLWSFNFEQVYRPGYGRHRGIQLKSTRRIERKIRMPFDLFGLPWGEGDDQRQQLAELMQDAVPDNDLPVDIDAATQLAAQALNLPNTPALGDWVQRTLASLHDIDERRSQLARTNASLRDQCQSFLLDNEPTFAHSCGWPAAPNATRAQSR
ncbi:competence protein CoiA [Amycolatopsis sp. lyj-23]|uniref:competence protein CoiA n=1 Tax=Amycolatopsis sp. lyj-23 TaxID=2789283 RepID=UPI00397A3B87